MCNFTEINYIIDNEYPLVGPMIKFYEKQRKYYKIGLIIDNDKLMIPIDNLNLGLENDQIFKFNEDIINFIIKNKLAKYKYINYICNYAIEICFDNLSIELLLQII